MKYLHGENGITFSLFNEISDNNYLLNFLKTCKPRHVTKKIVSEFESKKDYKIQIHLFPSFGRKYGCGEPDFIIIIDNIIFIGEVEVNSIKYLSKHFFKQMKKFLLIGNEFLNTKRKRLMKFNYYIGTMFFKGNYKLRKLFKEITNPVDKKIYYIVITNDHEYENKINKYPHNNLIKKLQTYIGTWLPIKNILWIGLPSICRLNLPLTKKVIRFNLKN